MVRPADEEGARLAALCTRLGCLWSEQEVEVWDEVAPWLFANHLVMLKPWIPNTPMHCYDFNTCEFWVQVFGLPLECFYDLDPPQEDADETVPEAPQPSSAMIPVKEPVAVAPLQWQPLIEESSRTTIELDKRPSRGI